MNGVVSKCQLLSADSGDTIMNKIDNILPSWDFHFNGISGKYISWMGNK